MPWRNGEYVEEKPKHPVTYVLDDGSSVDKLVKRISPDRLKTSCPEGSKYVVRFGPRSKQWEVYDLRRYIAGPSTGQFYSAPPPTLVVPEKDAAIGYAILM
jgi:hypothetical protein